MDCKYFLCISIILNASEDTIKINLKKCTDKLSNIFDLLLALQLRDRRSKAMFEACLADNVMTSLNVYVSHFFYIVETSREALDYFLSIVFQEL